MPSRWGEGAECLLERVLEDQAGKSTQRASALQGISLKKIEREREREREKARHGDQSSDGAKVFYSTLCRYLYSYKIAIFSRDKIKTYKLSRKHELIHMEEL